MAVLDETMLLQVMDLCIRRDVYWLLVAETPKSEDNHKRTGAVGKQGQSKKCALNESVLL